MEFRLKESRKNILYRFSYKEILVIVYPIVVGLFFVANEREHKYLVFLSFLIFAVIQSFLIVRKKKYLLCYLILEEDYALIKILKWNNVFYEGRIQKGDLDIVFSTDTSSRFRSRMASIRFFDKSVLIFQNALFKKKDFDSLENLLKSQGIKESIPPVSDSKN